MQFDTMIKDVIAVYQQNCGVRLTDESANDILCALLSVRDTEKILLSSPRHLLQAIFEDSNFYNKCVYSFDIVQLRNILKSNKINGLSKIIMFSKSCSDKVIKDQKGRLFLSLDPNALAEKNKCKVTVFGGMAIFDSNSIDIKDVINCVVVEGGGYIEVDKVGKIIHDTEAGCPVYTTSFIPGIDKYKFASPVKTFIINLPSLGIHNEKCKSQSGLQALQDVLSIRWDRHPDKKIYKRKPENYEAEYWAKSGFFDSIVQERGKNYIFASGSPKIQLNDKEQLILSTLLDINQKMSLGLTFRVAGGWVRDKLLGVPSDDIDIALDKITGQQFVQKALEYHKNNPQSPIEADSNYVIKLNPEKSKHLETSAINIAGLKIDFVNLRDETYGEDSRTPQSNIINDPKIDAQRRDLTINSLFYNVNSGQVEDYVGGLQDLQSMVLRTPLDPTKTFMDDPLRMLRVFRFFSRYPNAKIDPKTMEAMSNSQVHEAYRKKVSPERAGPEIIKMFGAERPAEAIRALFATGLDKAVFDVPEVSNLHPLNMNQRNKHHKFDLLEHTLRVVENLDKLMKQRNTPKKDRINMLMAAVFHDYGKAHPEIGKPKEKDPNEYTYVGHEDKSADIAEAILKKIGIGDEDRKFVTMVIRQHMRPHANEWTNKSIGKFIRDTQIPGNERSDIWQYVMMHAQADTMAKSEEGDQQDFDLKETHTKQMHDYINNPEPIQMKPLVDGMVLQKMFPHFTPKPPKGMPSFIKFIQEKLMEEQLAGNIKTTEQALQFVESLRGEVESMYNPPKQASNWYGKAKTADAASSKPLGDQGRLPSEGDPSEITGVKKMIYRSPGSPSNVMIGDLFRSKSTGVAFEIGKDNTYKVVAKNKDFVVLEDKQGNRKRVEIGIELPGKFIKV